MTETSANGRAKGSGGIYSVLFAEFLFFGDEFGHATDRAASESLRFCSRRGGGAAARR
jgi:hypothetical protein